MAEQVAYDEWLCTDQYDISGVSSSFGFERMVELKEFTCFPASDVTTATLPYKKRLPGPESAKASVTGYLDMTLNHPAISAAFGASPIITKGDGRALGSTLYMFVGKNGMFSYGGAVGEVVPLTAELTSDGVVTPGNLFEFGSKTATGNGTSRTILAVTSGKSRYLHAHVISVAGTSSPTLTLVFETSAIGDYTDAVTRHTFTDFTAAGVQRAVISTAVSDTNGRFRWTISGTDPVFVVRLGHGVR